MSQAMTGKERILKALDLGEPDTVPVFEMGINEGSIVNLGKHFTNDVPPVKHMTDMDLKEQVRYMRIIRIMAGSRRGISDWAAGLARTNGCKLFSCNKFWLWSCSFG